ncbi:MAG TPA: hypothetical protein DCO75_07545 [Fibrobacteres bacterium]|nr:hypothetical protein [Fibrobacterota bacterium]
MNSYKNKSVLIWDSGTFFHLAQKLAQLFGNVYYYSFWQSQSPKSNMSAVGVGFEDQGIYRVDFPFDVIDEVDLIVFPDVYSGDVQVFLSDNDYRVFGSRHGDKLELDRKFQKEFCKQNGIPIGPYIEINGIDELKEFVKNNDDIWIKTSGMYRGDEGAETFHSKNHEQGRPHIHRMEVEVGIRKDLITWICEKPIEGIEDGYDGYSIDGQFPQKNIYGVEVKDKAYLCKVINKVPDHIKLVNDKLSAYFKEQQYRNFFSTELRDGKLTDPCCRAGSPPSEIMMLMIKNIADVIYQGAGGELIEPEFDHKYGSQLIVYSDFAKMDWTSVQFPEEYADNIKFKNLAYIGDRLYFVPNISPFPQIGAVVAEGDTTDEAIEKCKQIAESIEGFDLRVFPEALDQAKENLIKLQG